MDFKQYLKTIPDLDMASIVMDVENLYKKYNVPSCIRYRFLRSTAEHYIFEETKEKYFVSLEYFADQALIQKILQCDILEVSYQNPVASLKAKTWI